MSSSGRWQKLFFFVFFSGFGFKSFLWSFLLLLSSADAIDEVDADVEAEDDDEAAPDDEADDRLDADAASDDAVEDDGVVVEDNGNGADAPEAELFAEAVMNSPISPASLTISSCVRSFSSSSGSEKENQNKTSLPKSTILRTKDKKLG